MISIHAAVFAVIVLIIAGLVFWLCWWLISYCGLPAPFDKVARVVLAIAAVLVCVGVLLSFVGVQIFQP